MGFSDLIEMEFIITTITVTVSRVGQLISCLLHFIPTIASIELDARACIFI